MAFAYNYAVAGLQEPGKMNVLSLENKTAIGNTFRFDDTGNIYKVLWCDEPQPTEFDAARLAIDGSASLKVAPISRPNSEAISKTRISEMCLLCARNSESTYQQHTNSSKNNAIPRMQRHGPCRFLTGTSRLTAMTSPADM
jgi:hypothetical protein